MAITQIVYAQAKYGTNSQLLGVQARNESAIQSMMYGGYIEYSSTTDGYLNKSFEKYGSAQVIGPTLRPYNITASTGSLTVGKRYTVGAFIGGTTVTSTGFNFGHVSSALGYYTGAKSLRYNANGGSGAPTNTETSYWASNSTMTTHRFDSLSDTVPTRPGYAFLGWSTSSSATTASYQPGATDVSITGTTLYAVWQKIPNNAPLYGSVSSKTTAVGKLYGPVRSLMSFSTERNDSDSTATLISSIDTAKFAETWRTVPYFKSLIGDGYSMLRIWVQKNQGQDRWAAGYILWRGDGSFLGDLMSYGISYSEAASYLSDQYGISIINASLSVGGREFYNIVNDNYDYTASRISKLYGSVNGQTKRIF